MACHPEQKSLSLSPMLCFRYLFTWSIKKNNCLKHKTIRYFTKKSKYSVQEMKTHFLFFAALLIISGPLRFILRPLEGHATPRLGTTGKKNYLTVYKGSSSILNLMSNIYIYIRGPFVYIVSTQLYLSVSSSLVSMVHHQIISRYPFPFPSPSFSGCSRGFRRRAGNEEC